MIRHIVRSLAHFVLGLVWLNSNSNPLRFDCVLFNKHSTDCMPLYSSLSSLSIFSVSHHKILCNDKKHYFLIKTSLFPSTLQDIITKIQVDKGCALYTFYNFRASPSVSLSRPHIVCLSVCVRVVFGSFFLYIQYPFSLSVVALSLQIHPILCYPSFSLSLCRHSSLQFSTERDISILTKIFTFVFIK